MYMKWKDPTKDKDSLRSRQTPTPPTKTKCKPRSKIKGTGTVKVEVKRRRMELEQCNLKPQSPTRAGKGPVGRSGHSASLPPTTKDFWPDPVATTQPLPQATH